MNKRATFFSGIPSNALPWAAAWLLVALQVACGGSDDSSTSPPVVVDENSPISSPVVDVDSSTPVPPLAVGSPAGTAVGITASASDPDPDNNQVSYELLEDAGGLFVIDANSGVVTTSGVLTTDALSALATVTTHSITVKAVSADGSSSRGTFTVRVEPENTAPVGPIADANADAPAFTFGQVSVDDPVGVTAQAADPDAFQAVSYTLANNAGGLFGIDESSGEIRFLVAPATAPNEATTLSVTVKATSTDGSSSTATFEITLLPASTPPPPAGSPISSPVVDVDSSTPVPPLAVGSLAGTAVGITASASDPDPDNNQVSYELLEDAGGLFVIDANSGVVTTSGVLTTDALSAPATVTTHSITVKAVSADGSSSRGTFTVRVEPENTAPVGPIADANADAPAFTFGQVSVDDPVGVTAQAADPDAFQAVSYTLANNAGELFGIDESSGEIRFLVAPATAPNEATTLSVTVKATSTDGSSSTATFEITLLPASTPPPPAGSPISSPVVDVDSSTPVPPLAVGSLAGTAVGITASASDPDNDQVSYELLEDAGGLFVIDANSGVVTTSGVLTTDALSAPATVTTHSITVKAVSADGSSSRGTFTVRVEPENTAPVGPIADANADAPAFTFGQVSVDDPVGVTAQAADPDAFQAVSYTLANNAGGLFGIDESSGEIRFLVAPATAPNEATTLSVTVKATSTDGSSSTATFEITLLPVPPDLIVHFPAPLSLTTTNTISFFGTAAPGVDGAEPVTVTVTVGDAEAVARTVTAEPFAWQVEDLPLNTNQTVTVAITAQDAMGRLSRLEYRVVQSSAVRLDAPVGLVLDTVNGRLLVADDALDGIVAVRLEDGARTELSTTENAGSGTNMVKPTGAMALDSASNRVLLMDSTLDAMFAIDLATGERSVLSSAGTRGAGVGLLSSSGLVLHPDPTKPNVALVSDGSSNDVVFEVNLLTGDRTVLSPKEDLAIGSWNTPRDIIVWTDSPFTAPFALVPTSSQSALFSVNLETGHRAVISSASTGTGPSFGTPRFMALRGTGHANRLLITDSDDDVDALLSVNLDTGDREVLSGSSGTGTEMVLVGAGDDFASPRGIALDDVSNIAYVSDIRNTQGTVVKVNLTTGDREELSPKRTLGDGPRLINPRGIALDRSTRSPRLLVVDDAVNAAAVVEVSLATGDRNIISGIGLGVAMENTANLADPSGLGLDPDRQRALVVDSARDALLAVDLRPGGTLGDRSVISANPDGNVDFASPNGRVALLDDDTALVADVDANTLFRIDLATGVRDELRTDAVNLAGIRDVAVDRSENPARIAVTVSSDIDDTVLDAVIAISLGDGSQTLWATTQTVGSGPEMTNPRGIAWDIGNERNRLLVMDADLDALIELDPGTLVRKIVSEGGMLASTGASNALAVDSANNRAWVISQGNNHVVMVHLLTGAQAIVSE